MYSHHGKKMKRTQPIRHRASVTRLGNPNPLRALTSSVPEVSSTVLYLSLPTQNLTPASNPTRMPKIFASDRRTGRWTSPSTSMK
jgi:hypothetical protein